MSTAAWTFRADPGPNRRAGAVPWSVAANAAPGALGCARPAAQLQQQSPSEAPDRTANEVNSLPPRVREELGKLDEKLSAIWDLGDNLVLAWTRRGPDLRFLAVRHYAIFEAFGADATGSDPVGANEFVNELLAGPKCLAPAEFERICAMLGTSALVVDAGIEPDVELEAALVDSIVTRYGVSLVRERAVVLLDAVGFSLRAPLDQLAMLNSLNYSVNSACRQLQSRDIRIDFARTTTGDGFYIWNRAHGTDATIALYELMMLILADNAVAQRKAKRFPVPRLRAAFHVGEHYEFYQVEALNPTAFGYIVGQVTVDLSRLIEKALPGQILLGEFALSLEDDTTGGSSRCDTRGFIAQAAARLDGLSGLVVSEDRIEAVRCYLTGPGEADGIYLVSRYENRDKHGAPRYAYNAKINIHLHRGQPIFLGIQHQDLPASGIGI